MSKQGEQEPVISVEGLTVEYKTDSGKLIKAVDNLSLHVNPGEVVGFIGPNGAGKSTTIKVLMGFRRQLSGSVRIFGLPPGSVESRRRIGFLPEVALYYPFLTARETLRMFAKLREIPRSEREEMITHLLKKVGLMGAGEGGCAGILQGHASAGGHRSSDHGRTGPAYPGRSDERT